jgi:hypothetical protein
MPIREKTLETYMVIDNETAMQPLGDDSRAPLKMRFDVIAQNFAILSDIYNRLYTWDLMVSPEIQRLRW